jgi:ABC-type Fe3+ transport system permease subunit
VLVYVPTNRPISIKIAAELRDLNLGRGAAYGVVLILIIAISMSIASRLERTTNEREPAIVNPQS